ncbi:hypothetical protein PIB30_066265 [Stylosanthes scabra]|uniref:Uncharacterized protein n=1 Tax=Stylosanthes scabra TaxID=79078 RepID=A0ABU6SNJ0_9FABA|nr:hypothetical protein [Stylosanthes scabra]
MTRSSLGHSWSSSKVRVNHPKVTVQASYSRSGGIWPNISSNHSHRDLPVPFSISCSKYQRHPLTGYQKPQLVCNVLERNNALAPRHVERMGLKAPPLYEGTDHRLINLELVIAQTCHREQPGPLHVRFNPWM